MFYFARTDSDYSADRTLLDGDFPQFSIGTQSPDRSNLWGGPWRCDLQPLARSTGAMRFVNSVVGSLVDTMIDDFCETANSVERDRTKHYVLSTLAKMPGFFRMGFVVLAMLFAVWSVPRHGRCFPKLNPAQRARQMHAWQGSRFTPLCAMMAFYRTFSTFGLYSAVYDGRGSGTLQ